MVHYCLTQVPKLVTFTTSLVANCFTLHGDQNGHSLEHCNDCLKRLDIEDLCTSGVLSIQQTSRFEISEIPHSHWDPVRVAEWYLKKCGSRKILAGSRNLGSEIFEVSFFNGLFLLF